MRRGGRSRRDRRRGPWPRVAGGRITATAGQPDKRKHQNERESEPHRAIYYKSEAMARGWESKSIEAQQEEAARPRTIRPALTVADLERADKRRTLELARARAVDDLSRATASAHRKLLERTLAAIDDQLRAL